MAVPLAAALTGTFVVAGPAAASATGTVTAAVAVANTHPAWAAAAADRGAAAASATLTPTVFYAGQDPAGMLAYAQAVSTPTSSLYRHYLTPAQYQARFGASATQVTAVRAWLTGAGLKITSSNAAGVTVTGTTAAVQRAFGVSLHSYAVRGGSYVAPTANARVPAALAKDVGTITGLTTMQDTVRPSSLLGEVTTSMAKGVTGAKATVSKGADGATFQGPAQCSSYYGQIKDTTDPPFNGKQEPYVLCGYVPSQLRGAYGVTQSGLTGKSVTIAVVDVYSSPTMLADANQYAEIHGDKPFKHGQYTETVTPAQWSNLDLCGGPDGWAGEESLDVEAVHAMAPAANVHYYGANSCMDADIFDVLETIDATHGADIVSDSWDGVLYQTGGDEDPTAIAEYNQLFAQGAIEGISYQFSSGDCGADDPASLCALATGSAMPQPEFPSSSPWVTAVGGTSLAIGKHNQQLWNTAWGTDVWGLANGAWTLGGWAFGAGGGTSNLFGEPFYQKGVVPTTLAETLLDGTKAAGPMRVAPDVSLDADPLTGFLAGMTVTLSDGSTSFVESDIGGTSLACPLFAGLQADAMQAQGGREFGLADPALYARSGSAALTDVTAAGPGTRVGNVLPQAPGSPAITVTFGDDQLLKAGRGYDDATGLGTPSPLYLWSYLF
jgi:subtilase family serine protease